MWTATRRSWWPFLLMWTATKRSRWPFLLRWTGTRSRWPLQKDDVFLGPLGETVLDIGHCLLIVTCRKIKLQCFKTRNNFIPPDTNTTRWNGHMMVRCSIFIWVNIADHHLNGHIPE